MVYYKPTYRICERCKNKEIDFKMFLHNGKWVCNSCLNFIFSKRQYGTIWDRQRYNLFGEDGEEW